MTNKPPETKTKEGIELASQPSWAQEEVGAFQRGEKRYLDLHLSEEEFEAVLKSFEATTVLGDGILAYHFVNTYSGLTVDSDDQLRTGFEGRPAMKVRGLFEELADTQDIMTTEMPNDFRATLAIQQGEIVLVAGLEKEECPLYCGECIDQKGQPDEFGVYVDDEHSCSHMDGEYDYIDKFWLGAMKFNEFEDRPDWGSWDISGLAHQHRTERKLGVRNEELKLQELEIGDVIRIVAGEEEKNRYIYEFDVKSAGIEPTVTFKQTGPDGNVVSLEDFEIILRGSGNWVGREWPLFRYSAGNHKQILIDYGTLHVGGDIVLSDPNRPRESRQVTLTPAISAIQLKRGARQWDFPE